MKKIYHSPAIDEVGGIATLTAAFGSDPRQDFSEFSEVTASTGSVDVCDSDTTNNDPSSFCE